MTTLKKTDGKTTAELEETAKMMAEHLIPKDDDTEYHKQITEKAKEPIQTKEDREYIMEEVKKAIVELKLKKSAGEDSITAEILQRVYKQLRKEIYALYNECLRRGRFPKKFRILPIIKPGKENSTEVTKFRPISLTNVAVKALNKLLINRIMQLGNWETSL
jgi:vacuolar-type H+-ATPase subunit F/Vma7